MSSAGALFRFSFPGVAGVELTGLIFLVLDPVSARSKGTVLQKVIEFCAHHEKEPMPEIEKPLKSANMNEVVSEWDAKFVDLDQEMLFELILAANYMDIKSLVRILLARPAAFLAPAVLTV